MPSVWPEGHWLTFLCLKACRHMPSACLQKLIAYMVLLKLGVCSTECTVWPEANLALCLKREKRPSNILVADHMNSKKHPYECEFMCKPLKICRGIYRLYPDRCVYVHSHTNKYKMYAHKHLSIATVPLNSINKDFLILHLTSIAHV